MVLGFGASAALSHKSLLFSRAFNFSCRPISHVTHHTRLLPVPLQTASIRCSSLHPLHSIHPNTLPAFTSQPRFHNFRVSTMADDGSGGTGGRGGSAGGSNSGWGGGDGASGDGTSSGGGKWSFLSWYLALLEKYPVPVKALTSAILTLIGDLICQVVIDQVQSLDLKRTFLFTLLGFVLVGPTLHFWYLYLSKLVTLPGASGALLRLVIDQFLFSPIFIGVFLAALVTLEGRPSQAVPKLKQEWFSALIANWQLWIPFQFLNFRFVPQQFQVLAANVIALVWNVILSFKAHKEVLPK